MFYHYHVNPKILKILSPEFRVILNRYPESLTIEIEIEKNLNILKLMGKCLALRKFGMHYSLFAEKIVTKLWEFLQVYK